MHRSIPDACPETGCWATTTTAATAAQEICRCSPFSIDPIHFLFAAYMPCPKHKKKSCEFDDRNNLFGGKYWIPSLAQHGQKGDTTTASRPTSGLCRTLQSQPQRRLRCRTMNSTCGGRSLSGSTWLNGKPFLRTRIIQVSHKVGDAHQGSR